VGLEESLERLGELLGCLTAGDLVGRDEVDRLALLLGPDRVLHALHRVLAPRQPAADVRVGDEAAQRRADALVGVGAAAGRAHGGKDEVGLIRGPVAERKVAERREDPGAAVRLLAL
jgi:hypothetical protein